MVVFNILLILLIGVVVFFAVYVLSHQIQKYFLPHFCKHLNFEQSILSVETRVTCLHCRSIFIITHYDLPEWDPRVSRMLPVQTINDWQLLIKKTSMEINRDSTNPIDYYYITQRTLALTDRPTLEQGLPANFIYYLFVFYKNRGLRLRSYYLTSLHNIINDPQFIRKKSLWQKLFQRYLYYPQL